MLEKDFRKQLLRAAGKADPRDLGSGWRTGFDQSPGSWKKDDFGWISERREDLLLSSATGSVLVMHCPQKTGEDFKVPFHSTRVLQRHIWPLFLVLIFLAVVLSIFYTFFIWSPWSQTAQAEVDGIREWENTTEAILLVPEKLNVANLLKAQSQEPPQRAMRSCLDEAVLKFSEEPDVLKENARMVLQCNGTRREFLSGEGENDIEVVWISGSVEYLVHEASPEVSVARLGRHPLSLNLSTINRIRQDLANQGVLEKLQGCLDKVVQEFPREPQVVQDNAVLMVSCGRDLRFISGEQQTQIHVYREGSTDEDIQYWVKASGKAWWARFFKRGAI